MGGRYQTIAGRADVLNALARQIAELQEIRGLRADLKANAPASPGSIKIGGGEELSALADREYLLLQSIARLNEQVMLPIAPVPENADTVRIGTIITIYPEGSSEGLSIHIVGYEENDPTTNPPKISHTAPIAQALFGYRRGDEVDVESNGQTRTYRIGSIWLPEDYASAAVSQLHAVK